MLKPASYLRTKARNDFFWEAERDYTRLGVPVTVRAWGFSRAEAIQALERAKIKAEQPPPQPFKALCEILWATAGRIDSLIVNLCNSQARLMTGKYDK